MGTNTNTPKLVDSRCSKCFSNVYRRLHEKFNVQQSIQQDFEIYLQKTIKENPLLSSPEVQRLLNIKFNEVVGNQDPFAAEKELSNQLALELYKEWKPKVILAKNPFDLALRLTIAGNIMDYGVANSFNVNETFQKVLTADFAIDHSKNLQKAIARAEKILYLGDNAGEIVFDKLFIETINHPNITFAVRGGRILNDATLEDADKIGMKEVAKLISNGYNAPSTVLEKCSNEFLEIYKNADLIISKGQGNLEGLINEPDSRTFFLLMAKCDVIAESLKVQKGSFIVAQLKN